ncbi:heavy metal translocating P-type ATPase [Aerosakkonemataceae cyanobacterium BLCC-F50]|uniref:Heavy metal translocating P-type ATPase n=1 Tax=Floridaenema flaviceps BLCC-F50 TaxID=3153642 RepID=A0ABV4XN34_9CYAN
MTNLTAQNTNNALQIVHNVPGRVRLKATDSNQVKALEKVAQKLRKQEGIYEVRTNSATKSLVATFDSNIVSMPEISKIIQQSGSTQPLVLVEKAHKQELQELLASGDLSEQYPRIARSIFSIIAGMAVTGALGVTGLMSLPVFMITDRVSHELLKYIESEFLTEKPESEIQSSAKELNGKVADRQEPIYSIVHETPGRIRFRIPLVAKDADYAQKLTQLAQSDSRVTNIKINKDAASVAICYQASDLSPAAIKAHLVHLIELANDPSTLIKIGSSTTETEEETNPWSNLSLPVATAVLALLSGPIGLPIPPIVTGGAIALATIPVAQRALESILTEGKLNIDFLDFSAIAITTLQGQFINPAIMLILIELGEAIREQTARSSKKHTLDLLDSLKQFVWVERNGEKQEISIHDVQKGDTVIVYPGDQIPVDGRILRGKALIDEQKLTGESMPVMRSEGQTVYTSTLVREGQLYILAEHIGIETRAGQIIKVMQDAPVHDTRIENYAAKVADQAVIPTLLLSGIVFGLTGNLARAASILTIDFATGIRVSVPTTVLAALTYAARRGILIRSGRALEKLATVDAVVFDKTGTLTKGEPTVVNVETACESISRLQVLELAAAAEQRITHPVAVAVVKYAEAEGARILQRGEWHYEIGLGIRAEIDGQNVLVGSNTFLKKEGISIDILHEKYPYLLSGSCSLIYVASNSELQGVIAYRDPLRAESRDVIKALRTDADMDIHILTGDNKRTAKVVASELGIAPNNTHAEAFPETKVAVVKALHEEGKTVAFVGDGINDSPALAYADVSVSFGDGSDVARETADVVLMENNLRGLPEAIAIARQALELINQNTAIVAVPNLSALVLAVLFGIPPLAATLVNNGSAIVAGLNGLRPLLISNEEMEQLANNLDNNQQPTVESTNGNGKSYHLEIIPPNGNGKPHHSVEMKDLEIISTNGNGNGNGNGTHLPKELSLVHLNGKPEPYNNRSSVAVAEKNGNSHSHVEEVKTLTGRALAERLKVSASTLSKRKSQSEFSQWSKTKDPEGITWKYSAKSQLFVSV